MQQHQPSSTTQSPPLTLVGQWLNQLWAPFANLPQSMALAFQENQLPVVTVVLVLIASPVLLMAFSILSILNALPLVAPFFKLVGLGYALWFTYNNLLFSAKRQRLGQQWQEFTARVVGAVAGPQR